MYVCTPYSVRHLTQIRWESGFGTKDNMPMTVPRGRVPVLLSSLPSVAAPSLVLPQACQASAETFPNGGVETL